MIADSFENARDAALAVRVSYDTGTHQTAISAAPADERPEQLFGEPAVIARGDAESVLKGCKFVVDQQYPTDGNQHNAIEPHASMAHWSEKDGKPFLTIHESTQSLVLGQQTYAKIFKISPKQVRVVCKYIGGAFGSKGAMWPQSLLACLCAKLVDAPVRVVVTRRQSYGGTGHRTPMQQRVAVGTDADGKIQTIIHSGVASTSAKDVYDEAFTMATRMMYHSDNLLLDQKRCRLNSQVPTFMRAPAETPGMFALESAIDEMAFKLERDPIDFRIANEPVVDGHSGKPFSSRLLIDCLRKGAAEFGWKSGPQTPRTKRDGNWLIGQGVAAATYPAFFFPQTVRVTINADGSVRIDCCTQEMGTGTMTAQTQLLADLMGIPASRVSMELGDTTLPPGGLSGGSATTASVGGAVRKAIESLVVRLAELIPGDNAMHGADPNLISIADGSLTDGENKIPIENLLAAANIPSISVKGEFKPEQDSKFANHSFGAQFVEVAVDEDFGLVRIRRMLGCFACGTIMNARTARSQFIGGMIMGVGHAMQESTHWDHRYGRITNDNLAEYHIPVNADIPDIDVMWIDTPDFNASPIGGKGIGEIGITGVAAAVTSAIHHATGVRVRTLPITPETVLAGVSAESPSGKTSV